ncbi:succinylglutamate desuccinylase/aspartoacylase family protein [Anabaena sp. UHCC 0253]|uniref:M14 family zinc carboxypeptidase n=1 Tax=Anabaena sp. UHCC 0253 TaxID=2590019 RepID=UPI001447F7DB|nr:succinylglutamate desuccinylase/aspartoacylase family protein [Anabaena sp. UHCC 0253]MTJ55941.1 succinylglutamate desuccinylase/aspartoacylase family protein [Anabaena sp. UHCC 0253]
MIPSISTHSLFQLASGDYLQQQIYKFIGATSGKKVYIQSNLHGSEIVGNAVIHELIKFLMTLNENELSGEIWLVPVCNPLGTNQRNNRFSTGRFNSYDGKDWNRIFWDYEKECNNLEEFAQSQVNFDENTILQNYRQQILSSFEKLSHKIAAPSSVKLVDKYRYKLQSLCLDADYLIDLHSNSEDGIDYLYYFPEREESSKLFLLEHGILFDEYDGDAFDEAFQKPWLALENALSKLGKPIQFDIEAFTLELGPGMKMNPDSVAKGVRGIKNYLANKGVLEDNNFPINQSSYPSMNFRGLSQVKQYWSPVGGMVQDQVSLETYVQQGDLLYQVLNFNKLGELPKLIPVYAEKEGLVYIISSNDSVNEGEFVLATF